MTSGSVLGVGHTRVWARAHLHTFTRTHALPAASWVAVALEGTVIHPVRALLLLSLVRHLLSLSESIPTPQTNAKRSLNLCLRRSGWIHALSLQTRGFYEEALDLYLEALGISQHEPSQASVYPVHHPLNPLNLGAGAAPQQPTNMPSGAESSSGGAAGGLLPEIAAFVLKNASKCCLSLGDWASWRVLQLHFRGLLRVHGDDTADVWRAPLQGLQGIFDSQVTEAMACVDAANFQEVRPPSFSFTHARARANTHTQTRTPNQTDIAPTHASA